ncbi:ABC transporter ATP-binding protein [Nodularia spumigena]|uniref:ABC transporter ATP-binding protein n=1 Tax=Nodularia spumigena TaxID=70799 RepID=UPI002B213AC8|nr:ATP-binding cassette domain-containing protein [Nodularia spumigena]MEA5558057.1 ATP-binding cassette domain-containing protein [Nodularia spumigena CH309]
MSPLVWVRDITRCFGDPATGVVAVRSVSFVIEPGELVAVVGSSGSGKSTLLEMLARWQRPDEGSIDFDDSLPAGWAGIAIVPQSIGLLTELTARENVRLAGGTVLLPAAAADAAMAEMGVDGLADRGAADMSLGEQQRVAVARATVVRPALLIADEPTAHQDEANADRVVAILRRCAAEGSGVVLATHDERLLGSVDRILRLADGSLVAD